MKSEDIREALRRNYSGQESAIVFEVPNGLASGRNNSGRASFADAIVCNMWRSRGFEMEGFEIKVSRSDWQRELQMPTKAEGHFERCDRWWLVTPHHGTPIARPEEIPGPWGWQVVQANGTLATMKKAPKLVPARKFDLEFAFALVRAASRWDRKAIDAEVKRLVDAKDGQFADRVNRQAAQLAAQNGGTDPHAAELMDALRQAFGKNLSWIRTSDVIESIQAMRKLANSGRFVELKDIARTLRESADAADAAYRALDRAKALVESSPAKQG